MASKSRCRALKRLISCAASLRGFGLTRPGQEHAGLSIYQNIYWFSTATGWKKRVIIRPAAIYSQMAKPEVLLPLNALPKAEAGGESWPHPDQGRPLSCARDTDFTSGMQ